MRQSKLTRSLAALTVAALTAASGIISSGTRDAKPMTE